MKEYEPKEPKKYPKIRRQRDENGRYKRREGLDQRQQDMIVELISNGGNKLEACRVIGVGRTTLYSWLGEEAFVKEYNKACERIFRNGLDEALKTMVNLMHGDDKRTALKAAEDVVKLNGYLNSAQEQDKNTAEINVNIVTSDE